MDVVFTPVLVGLALACGIVFGWELRREAFRMSFPRRPRVKRGRPVRPPSLTVRRRS